MQGLTSKTAEHELDRKWGAAMQWPWKGLGDHKRWPAHGLTQQKTAAAGCISRRMPKEGEAGAGINRQRCPSMPESGSLCTRGLPSPSKAGAVGRSSRSQRHPPGCSTWASTLLTKLLFSLCPHHTAHGYGSMTLPWVLQAIYWEPWLESQAPQDVLTSSWGAAARLFLPPAPFGEAAIRATKRLRGVLCWAVAQG